MFTLQKQGIAKRKEQCRRTTNSKCPSKISNVRRQSQPKRRQCAAVRDVPEAHYIGSFREHRAPNIRHDRVLV